MSSVPSIELKQMYVNHKAFNQLCGTSHDSRQPAASLIKSQLTQKKKTPTQEFDYDAIGLLRVVAVCVWDLM